MWRFTVFSIDIRTLQEPLMNEKAPHIKHLFRESVQKNYRS